MRFRWFSGEEMRFISPDLLMDLNRYAYVGGSPINYVDIFGLWRVIYSGHKFWAIPTNTWDNDLYLTLRGYRPVYSEIPNGPMAYDITADIHPKILEKFKDQEKRDKSINNGASTPVDYDEWCFKFAFGYDNFNEGRNLTVKNIKNFIDEKVNSGELEEVYLPQKGDIVIFEVDHEYAHSGIVTGLDDFIFNKVGSAGPYSIGRTDTKHHFWGNRTSEWYEANIDGMIKHNPEALGTEYISKWKQLKQGKKIDASYNVSRDVRVIVNLTKESFLRGNKESNFSKFGGTKRYFRKICKKGKK